MNIEAVPNTKLLVQATGNIVVHVDKTVSGPFSGTIFRSMRGPILPGLILLVLSGTVIAAVWKLDQSEAVRAEQLTSRLNALQSQQSMLNDNIKDQASRSDQIISQVSLINAGVESIPKTIERVVKQENSALTAMLAEMRYRPTLNEPTSVARVSAQVVPVPSPARSADRHASARSNRCRGRCIRDP